MICRGQLILMMDADGATRVSDVEKLEAALEKVAVKGVLCNFLWLPGLAVLESMASEVISAYQTHANAATIPVGAPWLFNHSLGNAFQHAGCI